jgi:hypothetical protein
MVHTEIKDVTASSIKKKAFHKLFSYLNYLCLMFMELYYSKLGMRQLSICYVMQVFLSSSFKEKCKNTRI